MSDNPKILVFDSGVGGLSVSQEILTALPNCELIFVSDNAGFPYGTRSEADLISRVELVVEQLMARFVPDILVVACNSASTVVLPLLRSKFSTPIVGVVPAIKPAAQLSKSKTIGILATPATIERSYTHQLIEQFANDCEVKLLGSSELVYQAERKLRGQAVDGDLLSEILQPFFHEEPALDTIVLACTHFPLIQEELSAAAPYALQWVDSGAAIARRVTSLVGSLDNRVAYGQHSAWLTINDSSLDALDPFLSSMGSFERGVIEI